MADKDVERVEHPVQNISLGRDVVVIQCTDGSSFDLSVGQCEKAASFRTTDADEKVVVEGAKQTIHLSYGTQRILSQWANEWSG